MRHAATAQARAAADLAVRRRRTAPAATAPDSWRDWLAAVFPGKLVSFAPHHEEFWNQVWEVRADNDPDPFVGIWPRGGGKTTGMEVATGALLAREARRFALYVCGKQDAANQRVQNIAALLTLKSFASRYPAQAERAVTPWGFSKGWTQQTIKASSGQSVLAVGLDCAVRGLNIEGERPDLVVFDDLDGREDTPEITAKKIRTLTQSVLPTIAGGRAWVVGVQNVIIPHGVFAQLADGRASFLVNRRVSGPVPAIRGLKTAPEGLPNGLRRDRIVAGEPTWAGQDLTECQRLIDTFGLGAFLREQNHEVFDAVGAMLRAEEIQHVADVPRDGKGRPSLSRVTIGVDPPGGRTECGIWCVAAGFDDRFYAWHDRSQHASVGPDGWGAAAVELAVETGGVVYVEGNYGGNMATFVVETAARLAGEPVRVEPVTAKLDKAGRAQLAVQAIQQGRLVFVGRHHETETELTTWVPKPGTKSPNRIDALAHAFNAHVTVPEWEPAVY